MFDKIDAPYRYVLYALVFPVFFQDYALTWAWGSGDSLEIAIAKRIFLLLPVAAIIAACWLTIICVITVITRQNRRQFVNALLVTWWDLARAIFSYWGGIVRFVVLFSGWLVLFVRFTVLGLWLSLQDILFAPLRAVKGVSNLATQRGTPWIAVIMTLAWCALEAFVFTFVMTNLVMDTLGSVTGLELKAGTVQIFLYFMLLAFVVGSYAIVATLESAVRSRNVKQIALVILVEFVALVFEVLFLYREFVDALVPWFTQYAGADFKLGLVPILMIASIVWAGTRGMTWFLFAAHGTPTIMAIIQRTGLRDFDSEGRGGEKQSQHFLFVREAIDRIMKDTDWLHNKGDELLSSFVLPPLQVVAAVVNFATMLMSARHLFSLPFKSYKDMLHADHLLNRVKDERS